MLSIDKRPDAQVHHVPRRAVVVAHEVEGHGYMGMAVVQAQIVLEHQREGHHESMNNAMKETVNGFLPACICIPLTHHARLCPMWQRHCHTLCPRQASST